MTKKGTGKRYSLDDILKGADAYFKLDKFGKGSAFKDAVVSRLKKCKVEREIFFRTVKFIAAFHANPTLKKSAGGEVVEKEDNVEDVPEADYVI
jgi:hypothetical protein